LGSELKKEKKGGGRRGKKLVCKGSFLRQPKGDREGHKKRTSSTTRKEGKGSGKGKDS